MSEVQAIESQTAIPAADESQELEAKPSQESSSEAGAEQTSTQQAVESESTKEEQAKADKKGTPWYQHRINELTRERKEAAERAREESVQRQRIEQELEALRNGVSMPASTMPANDIEKTISERVNAELRAKEFNEACNKVYSEGQKDFSDFDKALQNFGMLGEMPPHFIEAAVALDGGHKILYHLGQNLDQAAELLSLSPVKLGVEMAKIKSQLDRPIPKSVSRAPAPIKPIDSGGKGEVDLSNCSMEDFAERRNREAPIKR